jgi:hypothetical protein
MNFCWDFRMIDEKPIFERDPDDLMPDPDELPVRDRKVITQPYDSVIEALVGQIKSKTIFLRPISDRPKFQRNYVWSDEIASRLIESIILNVPIPPCYFSEDEDSELDVIDGQQRLYSIYRFLENQFKLKSLEVMKELNGFSFHQLDLKIQRQIRTHTLRCVVIKNQSHPEIRFDVFERLNTNTVPLNAQELRNCIYRGSLNDFLGEASLNEKWLRIIGRKTPDKRLQDEEIVLRFMAFETKGLASYRTPLKHWLNEAAKEGRRYGAKTMARLELAWAQAIDVSLIWFEEKECFRRPGSRAINKALFDLICSTANRVQPDAAVGMRQEFRLLYFDLLKNEEFLDLISRAVDHKKRTNRRFQMWAEKFAPIIGDLA